MRFFFGLLLTALLAMPAVAQPWYARGEFNGWTTDNPLTNVSGNHWSTTITGLFDNTPYNFKIADANWTGATTHPNSDVRVYTDPLGEITVHLYDQTTWSDGWFPNATRRVGYDDHGQFDWEIVGSFNGWPGDAHDPAYALTDMGNGLHRGVFTFDQGIYDFKFRGLVPTAGIWDTSIGNDFGNGAGNNSFAVTADDQEWIFELDLPNGRVRYFTEDVPDLQGDHNSDGSVNAADYVTWRKTDGGNETGYTQFRQNFGMTGGGGPATWIVRSPQFADVNPIDQGGGLFTAEITGLTPGTEYDVRASKTDLSANAPLDDNAKIAADANGEINVNIYELTGASWGDGWNPNSEHRLGYADSGQHDWEIVGGFNNWPGANDPLFALTDQTNGLHAGQFTFDTPGTYPWKFRHIAAENPWSMSIGDNFSNSANDNSLTITNPGEVWRFELDLPNGRWRAFQVLGGGGAVPEPSSMLLMALVGLAICGMSRRK
jgi:hypothetical protein